MHIRHVVLLLAFTLAVSLLAGCGPSTGTVSGDVLVDGKPLVKGRIVYSPYDGNSPSAESDIKDGKYELRTLVGKKRVQITEDLGVMKKKEHQGPNAPWMEVPKGEGLPARYNANTELVHDVTAGGNAKDWKLERKASK